MVLASVMPALAAALFAGAGVAPAAAQSGSGTADCQVVEKDRAQFLFHGPLDACARLIRIDGGTGFWGRHRVEVDFAGRILLDGAPAGLVGDAGDPARGLADRLVDRCLRGNADACAEAVLRPDQAARSIERLGRR